MKHVKPRCFFSLYTQSTNNAVRKYGQQEKFCLNFLNIQVVFAFSFRVYYCKTAVP